MQEKKRHLQQTDKNNLPDQSPMLYPPGEDIYNQLEKLEDADPEDVTQQKEDNDDEMAGTANEKSFSKDISGSDLDIPGAELDDEEEITGNEDEENNHYSIGGDNHNDLEEDNRQ